LVPFRAGLCTKRGTDPTPVVVRNLARRAGRGSVPLFVQSFRAATLLVTVVLTAPYLVSLECAAGDRPHIPALSLDRSLQPPLATARALIARGQTGEAIRELQPLLADRENALVEMDGRYVDAKVAANELIAGLPAEARAQYERDVGADAQREMQQALAEGRLDRLLQVSSTYRHTEAGRQALAAATGLLLDSGQFIEAVAAARELLATPGATEGAAAARLVTARLKLGQASTAKLWIENHRDLLTQSQLETQGTSKRALDWLAERISQSTADKRLQATLAIGGHAQAVESGLFARPSVQPIWNRRFEPAGTAGALAQDLIVRRVESGVPPVFQPVPLVIGNDLVIRRSEELAAFDLKSGKFRWSAEVAPTLGNALESDALSEREFAGGPQSGLSTDGKLVFTVVEDTPAYGNRGMGRRRRMQVEVPPKNSLCAFSLPDGKRVWRLAEIQPLVTAAAAEQADHDIDFLGPPLACGKTLYVLGRTNDGANLLALNPADGTVRWGKSLAGFSGFESEGATSIGPPCVPFERDGLLICPTPDGIVFAFDLATRTCRWAYRAQPTEEPVRLPPRWGRRFPAVEERWLHAWRECVVRLDDRRCFFISPRSGAIHALSVDSGSPLWSQTVKQGLFLAPIIDGPLVAISQYRAIAFDRASGARLWSSAVGLPSGRGFAAKGRYYLPQADGGLATIDLQTGHVEFPIAPPKDPPGNLLPLAEIDGGAALSQSNDRVALLASLDGLMIRAAKNLERHPNDTDARRQAAELDRESGNLESAERLYRQLLDSKSGQQHVAHKVAAPSTREKAPPAGEKPPAELLLFDEDTQEKVAASPDRNDFFETLCADLQRNPHRYLALVPQLLKAAVGEEQRAIALRSVALALAGQGQRLQGLDALLELARLDLPAQIEIERGPRRIVAFERQLGSDLRELLEACTPAERRQADSRIEAALERGIAQGDLSLFGRVFQRVRNVGLERAFRRKIEAALRPDSAFSQNQLELWDATTSAAPRRAAQAWRDLAELSIAHSNRRQAALCLLRLNAEHHDFRFDDGLRPAELIAAAKEDRTLSREIEEAAADPWSTIAPEALPDTESSSNAQFFQLPIEILPGSLCERLDVALDHEAETLRFQGNGQTTYWDLKLPTENSRLRNYLPLHRAWGIGPLAIVQVGTDLFGVAPLDEGGEPVPTLLWHVDLLVVPSSSSPSGTGNDLDVRVLPGAFALTGERVLVTDHLGRPVARVGPVRPGYLCYQDRGSLVAIDPLSGKPLWRRTDVPAADLADGDDALLALVDRRAKRLQILRVLDGKTIGDRNVPTASNFRWLDGLDAVTQIAEAKSVRLSRIDLQNDRPKWSLSFPAESQFVRLDSRRYLSAESDGTFHVLDAAHGVVLSKYRLPQVKRCVQIHVASDENRFYLAFSSTLADMGNFRPNGQRNQSRNPLVSGALCAVDRHSAQMLWSRSFADGAFALDQSRATPVLIFSYRQFRKGAADDDENGMGWPVLHCVDKRTGKDVFRERFGSLQPLSRPFAEAELGRHEVIVRCPDASIRFRYAH
jgi:outer membrane protein assembly factor BamB